MDFEKFKKKFDDYMATPQAQIDIDNIMERIRKEEIESRIERNIPLEFSNAQEDALEVLRDLCDEQVDDVLDFFQKEREEKNMEKLEIIIVNAPKFEDVQNKCLSHLKSVIYEKHESL